MNKTTYDTPENYVNTIDALFEARRVFTDDGEFYDGLRVIESGKRWCIAQRPDGSYVRHFVGQCDAIFTSINRALDDCGVITR